MLSIFELIILFAAGFICIVYIQIGASYFMNKKFGVWMLYTVIGAITLATMFKAYSEFIVS